MRKNKGFTLIELLVTASIIGVLMLVGIITYSNSRLKAKDSRRREDLLTIQSAMEQYYAIQGQYPASCPSGGLSAGGNVILDNVPLDPDGGSYSGGCNSARYCYSVELELDSGNCAGCSCDADSCSFNSGDTHFCVKHKL